MKKKGLVPRSVDEAWHALRCSVWIVEQYERQSSQVELTNDPIGKAIGSFCEELCELVAKYNARSKRLFEESFPTAQLSFRVEAIYRDFCNGRVTRAEMVSAIRELGIVFPELNSMGLSSLVTSKETIRSDGGPAQSAVNALSDLLDTSPNTQFKKRRLLRNWVATYPDKNWLLGRLPLAVKAIQKLFGPFPPNVEHEIRTTLEYGCLFNQKKVIKSEITECESVLEFKRRFLPSGQATT
jgi:hypothetical protein